MAIRIATLLDIPQLCVIESATQLAPWSRETFEKCFQMHSRGWVITAQQPADKVLGFVLAFVQVDECHILNMCVDPSQQRRGFGTQLMLQALSDAKQQGAEFAYLEVRKSNKNAIALYEKLGFKKIGERKNYYSAAEGHEDAWVFAMKFFE